jgi:tRNA pseudouridine55 synthase
MSPLNGVLLINKPSGCTSHDVVARARRLLGLRAIGHAGTLDPLASGLLVLLLGEGTKLSDYILNGNKTYEVLVRLGLTTDTQDLDGQILREENVNFDEEAQRGLVTDAVHALGGDIQLPVPLHSAVKIGGRKLYEYAREGSEIEAPMREMGFYDLTVLDTSPNTVRVRMRCSKGSFVRAWADTLGARLGCGGAVAELKRVHSEPFGLDQALSLETLADACPPGKTVAGEALGSAWVPLRESLPAFKMAWVEGHDERLLRNGQISHGLQAQLLKFVGVTPGEIAPGVRVLSRETQDLVAILTAEPGAFYRIKRVFNSAIV